jgi:hypothetical protein
LVLAARDQCLWDRPSGELAWRWLKGKGTGGKPKGTEPDSDGRRDGTGERRTKGIRKKADEGEEPGWANGKPEESPGGNPRT